MAKADRHNRFVEAYNTVVRLLQAGDLEGTAEAVAEMTRVALPGRQTEAVAALDARLAKLRSAPKLGT